MASFADLKLADLKNLCSERRLNTRGTKAVLLQRLRQSEQPAPVLKQEQDEPMTAESLLESTTPKSFEASNIPVEQLESLPYSPNEPELMASSILQGDDTDHNQNMDIDSERTSSEPLTPPLPSPPITESTKLESEGVKQEQPNPRRDYFSFYGDKGSFKLSPNDFAQIVVERKYLVNPAAIEQQSRKNVSSPMLNSAAQFYQQPVVNGNNSNLQLPYKYDQLFELTKHQWVYHDGETPRWFNYDTAAFAMKQPGVAVECIFRVMR